MHTCIHAYMHICIHAFRHTCIHAYMQSLYRATLHGIALHYSMYFRYRQGTTNRRSPCSTERALKCMPKKPFVSRPCQKPSGMHMLVYTQRYSMLWKPFLEHRNSDWTITQGKTKFVHILDGSCPTRQPHKQDSALLHIDVLRIFFRGAACMNRMPSIWVMPPTADWRMRYMASKADTLGDQRVYRPPPHPASSEGGANRTYFVDSSRERPWFYTQSMLKPHCRSCMTRRFTSAMVRSQRKHEVTRSCESNVHPVCQRTKAKTALHRAPCRRPSRRSGKGSPC